MSFLLFSGIEKNSSNLVLLNYRFYTKESRLTHGVSPNEKSEEPVCVQEV